MKVAPREAIIPITDRERLILLIIRSRQVFLRVHFFFFGIVEENRDEVIKENLKMVKELPVEKVSTLVTGYDV